MLIDIASVGMLAKGDEAIPQEGQPGPEEVAERLSQALNGSAAQCDASQR
ncbi:MAG: hypothetical protein L0Z50_40935 [Verrucomicrobiales bacterium]|nr:hypothetical protein [Verrucomicrobiales bacterium]